MLQVILEQKNAPVLLLEHSLAAYATEYGYVQQLTGIQLDFAGKVVKVLGCIEITKSVSTEAASTPLIIPFVQALHLALKPA